ncbi:tRNA uridine-5-carboxymethylaminomethyl(34) synthesis GTPase MnmE [Buchnera aphidicola]|uniref:tRNA uridine-5-carboxymethylaminomethyl(34) synthesis GTPase MnmE n=1 Tax=Buchnera aphidicola TaxID=9 RepID=UPI00094D1E43|nr:tRNA uridine-5-carboxymethylaminomethyl(34) synthesis GTPase MnmE [Buchnera aphidicola]
MIFDKTIVAPATAPGQSGVGIIRVSGSAVIKVIEKFLRISMKPRFAHYTSFSDITGKILDYGIALFFPAPFSFTGEDILEFHGHGNSVLLDLLMKNILLIKNVRIARPGEFSERAFLNNKMDLVQAEGINDLINAQSELSIQASLRSLNGDFSKKIRDIISLLKKLYARIEAVINFPDEINESSLISDIRICLSDAIYLMKKLIFKGCQGNLLYNGISIVITGPTNVGKSSLFNYLSNQKISIVTNIPGTTRDVMCKNIWINGARYELVDTAGLRKSNDVIELIGIKLAKKNIQSCRHIFLILDASQDKYSNNILVKKYIDGLRKNQNITIIFNKIDLIHKKPCLDIVFNQFKCIYLSIKYKMGINFLKDRMHEISSELNAGEDVFLARNRHLSALKASLKYLKHGKEWLNKNLCIELFSEDVRLAIEAMLTITGNFSSSDLLEKIFSDFCIGK